VSLQIPEQEIVEEPAADGDPGWRLEFRAPLPVEGWNAQISLLTGMAAADMMLYGEVGVLRTMPPADPGALRRLRQTPLKVVALVNSLEVVGEAQLSNAGIRGYFDGVISADSVRRLKPAAEPYHAVAKAFEVDIADVRLVAAHSWDVSGALAAGCRAAFVARPNMVLSPIGTQPDIVEPDIAGVVDRIVAADVP
jgi:2-haloacid dehalogenase